MNPRQRSYDSYDKTNKLLKLTKIDNLNTPVIIKETEYII